MQRRENKRRLKLGFCASVSARALIIFCPMAASLAHDGTRPQRCGRTWRNSSPTITGPVCPGTRLYLGSKSFGSIAAPAKDSDALKRAKILCLSSLRENRPHMDLHYQQSYVTSCVPYFI